MTPQEEYGNAIKSKYDYDPVTGIISWKIDRPNAKKGTPVGRRAHQGYLVVRVCVDGKGRDLMSHRMAWLLQTGDWPDGQIDHINRDRTDNRFENLRDVDARTNSQNKKFRADGVTHQRGKFRAMCRINGKQRDFGSFETLDIAQRVVIAIRREFHNGFLEANHDVL